MATNKQSYELSDPAIEAVYAEIGRRVAAARREQGLSQEVLAAMADIDRSHIGFIEQGRRKPTIVTLFKICRVLKLSLEDLFKGL